MLQSNTVLKSLIDKLWDQLWSGGVSNPLTAIQQITYLLFMKQMDEREAKREKDAEWIGEEYKSRFSGTYIPYVDPGLIRKTHEKLENLRKEKAAPEKIKDAEEELKNLKEPAPRDK